MSRFMIRPSMVSRSPTACCGASAAGGGCAGGGGGAAAPAPADGGADGFAGVGCVASVGTAVCWPLRGSCCCCGAEAGAPLAMADGAPAPAAPSLEGGAAPFCWRCTAASAGCRPELACKAFNSEGGRTAFPASPGRLEGSCGGISCPPTRSCCCCWGTSCAPIGAGPKGPGSCCSRPAAGGCSGA
jgi:hypothetical protein